MAEVKYRGDIKRNILHKVVPIDTPYVIGCFVGDICNFNCKYCVQSLNQNEDTSKYLIKEFMGFDIFGEIANQISKFPTKIKTLLFSSMGEPTLNRDLFKMIKKANELTLAENYEIVTNASLLNPEMSRLLIDAGLTRINISIQGVTKEKYKEICGFEMDMDKLINHIAYFYQYSRGKCKVHIKTLDIALDEGEDRKFYHMFSDICDTIHIDSVVETTPEIDFSMMTDKCNNLVGRDVKDMHVQCCSSIFYTLYVLPNGDVIPCCDPPYPMKYGNIKERSIVEIFQGKERTMFLKAHLEGKRKKIKICKDCKTPNQLVFKEEDLLDGYEEEVLRRLSSKEDKNGRRK